MAEDKSYVQIANTSTEDLLTTYNLPPVTPKIQVTFFGKIRTRHELSCFEWFYLLASTSVLTISLGITIERFTAFRPCQCDFAFGLLLLVTIMFCYYYVIHSILVERCDELLVFVASKGIVAIYCIVNYFNGERNTLRLIRLILACGAGPILIISGACLCYKYYDSNHFIHDAVGGNSGLQKVCRMYYYCSSLLKFDLQLQLSMLILVIGRSILDMTLTEKIVYGSGVPVIFLVFILGRLGIYYENKRLMIVFYTLSLIERGYIIYNFYYTYTVGDNVGATYNPVLVCGGVAVVIWILLFCTTGYFTKKHFGKGLKEKLHGQSRNNRGRLVEVTNINREPGDGSGIETTVEETLS